VNIEGTVLAVCARCAKFGTEVGAPPRRESVPPVIAQRLARRKRRMSTKDVFAGTPEEELAFDFAARIRRAREARGWRQSDLAAKINEKASVVAKLEAGAITPPDALVRKLERILGIKLTEKVEAAPVKARGRPGAFTLGDFLEEK
jgi:putative transcription factor